MTTSALRTGQFTPSGMIVVYDGVLAADAASFDVQNIPQGYKHLRLVLQARGTTGAVASQLLARFNNDSGANYDHELLVADDTTVAAGAGVAGSSIRIGDIAAASADASRAGICEATVPNYAETAFFKYIRSHGGWSESTAAGGQSARSTVGTWRSTAAITRITLLPDAGNFLAGSRLTIYGMGGNPSAESIGDLTSLLNSVRPTNNMINYIFAK